MGPGTIIGGKYLLEQPLAAGGMGSVWAGRHMQLGSPVAVKFMAPAMAESPALRSRFEREARSAALLESPHVVRILDFGFDGSVLFIAMELLRGETLGARIKRDRRLPISRVVPIALQTCKALRRAHDAGIIHRDLKPQNIFLARDDEDEVVKVLDFGIAKVLGSDGNETTTGSLLGSPLYMSPEQVRRGRDVDARSDLWSLAVVLYRCLTGQTPFGGTEMGDIIVRICTETPAPPSAFASDLSPEVDAFFARALAREPERRFESATEFARAFAALDQNRSGAMEFAGSEPGVRGYAAPRSSGAIPSSAGPPPRSQHAGVAEGDSSASRPAMERPNVEPPQFTVTPAVQALSVVGEIGTLTNATSDTDVRAQAARSAAQSTQRARVAIGAAFLTIALGVGLVVVLMRSHGDDATSAGSPASATEASAAATVAATPIPTAEATTLVVTPVAPASSMSASAVASAPSIDTARPKGGDAKPPPREATPANRGPKSSDKQSSVLGF